VKRVPQCSRAGSAGRKEYHVASFNKTIIVGNVGRDPEKRNTNSGKAVINFSVAVNSNTKLPSGDWKEETTWFRVVAFDKLAERVFERAKKGASVLVEGRIQTSEYTNKEGAKVSSWEVVASDIRLLDRKPREDGGFTGAGSADVAPAAAGVVDEEIPF